MTEQADRTAGPEMAGVRMHLCTPASPAEAVCVSNERCTAGSKPAGFVRHVALDVSGTALEGTMRPGQSFGVLPPGLDERGQPHKLRLYSVASPSWGEDGGGRVFATTVKRTIDEHWETGRLFLGVASNYLCDLAPGDRVRLTGPSGKRFVLPARPAEHDFVLFATGTGIAPFRGMVQELVRSSGSSRVVLVMGAAYSTDLLYHGELLKLESEHGNFRYLTAVSREVDAAAGRGLYVSDRLLTHREELTSLLSGERSLVYVCGIAGLELSVLKRLATVLPRPVAEQFVQADSATMGSVEGWTRRMLHREVRPTRRFFVEVY